MGGRCFVVARTVFVYLRFVSERARREKFRHRGRIYHYTRVSVRGTPEFSSQAEVDKTNHETSETPSPPYRVG